MSRQMSKKTTHDFPNRTCKNGQSVFDVADEMKADGLIPQRSMLGHRCSLGDVAPENAVAVVTVRVNENFWIVRMHD